MNKNIYVAWSGGCDSTALLHKLSKDASEKNPVIALSITSNVIVTDLKQKLEKKSREAIKEKLKDKYIKYVEVDVNFNIDNGISSKGYGLPQASLWLGLVLPHVEHNSIINFGYIKGDDFWHYRYYIDNIIRNMGKINHLKDIELAYPFEWKNKSQAITYLKKLGLYKHIWFCEEPRKNKNKCGRCTPCQSHKKALTEMNKEESQL